MSVWTNVFQSQGAVFLPLAGRRENGNEIWHDFGCYWSSSIRNDDVCVVYKLGFSDHHLYPMSHPAGVVIFDDRYAGYSVRLVQDF